MVSPVSMKANYLCAIGCWAVLGLTTSVTRGADAARQWTDATGRKVEAAFAGADGASVKLRMADGTVIPYPLEKLSAEDQAWVKSQAPAVATPTPAVATPTSGMMPGLGSNSNGSGGAGERAWPRSVALEELPKATIVKEDAEKREYVYRTAHFEFQCDARLGADVVREFSRIFEATRELNVKLPLGIDPKPEKFRELFVAKLYSSREDYFANGGVKGSAGIYTGADRCIKVPLQSLGVKLAGKHFMVEPMAENDTLVHEITHQMMNHWLGKLPEWYVEGSAEYAGSCHYNQGRFTLPRLGQSAKGLEHLHPANGKALIWHVSYLMSLTPQTWAAGFGDTPDGKVHRNYASAVALTYYFYNIDDKGDGSHMIDFMHDIAAGKSKDDATQQHLIRGRDFKQIEKEMVTGLRRGGIAVEFTGEEAGTSGAKG